MGLPGQQPWMLASIVQLLLPSQWTNGKEECCQQLTRSKAAASCCKRLRDVPACNCTAEDKLAHETRKQSADSCMHQVYENWIE